MTVLLQKIEELKKQIIVIEQEVREEEEFKFFPQAGERFCTISFEGDVKQVYNASKFIDNNAYKTKEEAERARDIAVAKHKLRQIIEWKNDGWEPDWNNGRFDKYVFSITEEKLCIDSYSYCKVQPSWMYMKDEKTAQWILDNYRDLVETMLGE